MPPARIYCSGPLFCAEEVGGMNAIAKVLEGEGYTTFLPHRDGLEAYLLRFGRGGVGLGAAIASSAGLRARVDEAIFALDVYELVERCAGVVCNLDGRVPDEGMIVEASLAYATGKALVLFKDDARAPFGGYDNAMLTSLVRGEVVVRRSAIPGALAAALARARPTVSPVGDLGRAVAYGRRISGLLARLPEDLGKERWPDAALAEVLDAG
ncbi:MAG: nucleoside 2-deoxyribosyltransferase [Myxococcales bacterium]|nr:nucleoside 2-deoxyribosyltransferase [Myxococcales bacterium]